MKKMQIMWVSIVLTFSMTACNVKSTYNFLHSAEQITSVYIVDVQFDKEGNVQYTKHTTINNVDDFLDDFEEVSCRQYFGDPIGLSETSKVMDVIKVVYENNDYELIAWNGQAEYTQERGFRNYVGYRVFDKIQFMTLIMEYSPN